MTTTLLLKLAGVAKANELLLTGRVVGGAEMQALGVANYAEEGAEEVEARALDLAREIAKAAPVAVRWTKASLRSLQGIDEADARRVAWQEALRQSATLERRDAAEGRRAVLEKREAKFSGQ